MAEKRRVSSRHKAEPPSKKRTPTLVKEPARVEQRTRKKNELPFRVKSDQALPTLLQAQPLDLPNQEYQSIPRSGVLAASLERSRQKWISEGIFEKYWTKPSRKKSQAEAANNPPRDTMLKVGVCKLTIEPHVFEVTLFTIKESNPAVHIGQATQPQFLQYGLAQGAQPSPVFIPPSSAQNALRQPPLLQHPYQQNSPQSGLQPTSALPVKQPPPINTAPSTPAPSAEPLKPNQDPVIQMLATRASSNAQLKALMKVVASGSATHDQLKVFQGHIDELTAMLAAQKGSPAASATTTGQPTATSTPFSTQHPAPTRTGSPYHNSSNPANGSYPAPANSVRLPPMQSTLYPETPTSMQSRPPLPLKRPDITGIALEFSGSQGDRFLFPTHSILEFFPGNRQVIASFLVIRRGSAAASGAYKADLEYYQPVTVRLTTDFPKLLEPLARVVRPQDEVRKWMNDVMDRCARAEYVHLAVRLPRAEGMADEEDDGDAEARSREESASAVFMPAKSMVPERRKTGRRIKAS